MTLLSSLECVVGSAWIGRARKAWNCLTKMLLSNGVGDDEELSVDQVAGDPAVKLDI